MAKTRKQLQEQRNKAVVAQRQAKLKSGIGSKEHKAAIKQTKSLGDKMRARVKDHGDTSKASHAILVSNVDEYVDSKGKLTKKVSLAPTGSGRVKTSTAKTTAATVGPWTGTETDRDVRGGYDPSGSVDMTNTNPAYWASAVRYFKAHPRGNPNTGELGIWIPNLEKEGNERVALAAIAGGVTAHVGSNYSNNTIDNDWAQKLHKARGDTAGAEGTYNIGGAEKVIRLAGTHRGGVLTDTGYDMGSTAPTEHGVHIKGGRVVKGAGGDYVKGGGDFGGLLSMGDTITGSWLDGVLGGMDKDGLRIRGTYPAVAGATGSGIGAGGTKTSVGGLYGGGVDPLASMPKVSDYTPYMDPNSIFGGLSKNAAVRSGLLYNPEKLNYGEEMAAAGMPAFSPGLLGSFTSAGGPTYSSPPSGFMKTKATTTPTSGSTLPIGSTTAKYAIPETIWGYKSSLIPKFASKSALDKFDPTTATGGTSHWAYTAGKGWTPGAFVGGELYTPGAGKDSGGMWDLYRTYDPVTPTTTATT